jgi:hypothetical protein
MQVKSQGCWQDGANHKTAPPSLPPSLIFAKRTKFKKMTAIYKVLVPKMKHILTKMLFFYPEYKNIEQLSQ